MALWSETDGKALEKRFASLTDEVSLVLFVDGTSGISKELETAARAIAGAGQKLKVEVVEAEGGKSQRMKDLKVADLPCLVLAKHDFSRIRYYGVPLGYELPPLVDAIVELSNSRAQLSPKALESLSTVRRRANIKVFVLPTCPFCPTVARHAYRAAIGSQNVTTEVIDSSLFVAQAARHSVMGVPKVILNDSMDITGAMEETPFFEKLRDADHSLIDSMFG